MPEIYKISEWNTLPWYSTGGTRDKKYIQSPDGKYYYFKTSLLKPDKDYRYEFWSEIIAYEVGNLLGFNILKYDIAIDNDKIGCLCESMIVAEKEELLEGIKYLQAVDNTFNPEDVKLRNKYSFQLIEEAFTQLKYEQFLKHIVEMAVFDSLIGNGDRHQENWAFISDFTLISKTIADIERGHVTQEMPGLFRRLVETLYFKGGTRILKREIAIARLPNEDKVRFAPIYDSGSSMGRELNEAKIEQLLSNPSEFESYINRGKSEIHWETEKLSHFSLIDQLRQAYCNDVDEVIERITQKFDVRQIEQLVWDVDNLVPDKFEQYKLSPNRKTLIIKIITLRFERLRALVK